MSIIQINGVDLPAPSKISIRTSDIDEINMNELGYEQRDNIRTGKYSIDLGFTEMNNSETHLIQSALDELILNVKFPTARGFEIRQMRVDGDIELNMVDDTRGKIRDEVKWNISFNLIEY